MIPGRFRNCKVLSAVLCQDVSQVICKDVSKVICRGFPSTKRPEMKTSRDRTTPHQATTLPHRTLWGPHRASSSGQAFFPWPSDPWNRIFSFRLLPLLLGFLVSTSLLPFLYCLEILRCFGSWELSSYVTRTLGPWWSLLLSRLKCEDAFLLKRGSLVTG
jgi:hypothetical protein